jgi:hypothetical protein
MVAIAAVAGTLVGHLMGGGSAVGAMSTSRCPSPAAAVVGVETPTSALRGDVDGDGHPDASFTYFGRPRDCNYLVVGSTASGRVSVRIPRPDFDDPLPPGVPFVTVLARISALPGAAIVVTTHEGASTAFAGVYLVRGSRLVRARIPWCCGLSNSFAYGGSADNYWGRAGRSSELCTASLERRSCEPVT